ncbi:MAK10-like protein [Tanacetum coccineum]
MGDENPIRTLRDYSKPSHEGYTNTIELPKGNNVVPLRSDTIRLVQNGWERTSLRLFQFFLRDQASNWLEHLSTGSISTWEDLTIRFLAQFFPSRTIDQSADGKLRDRNTKESWALLEDLALYDNKSWNHPMDFAKPVKAISLPQDVPTTQLRTRNSTSPVFSARSYPTEDPQCSTRIHSSINAITICPKQPDRSQNNNIGGEDQEENDDPENINTNPPSPLDLLVSFVTEKVRKLNSFLESLTLVPQSSNIEYICTKGDVNDVIFTKIIKKYDDSREEGLGVDVNAEIGESEVEYFDTFPTRSELAYHKYLMSGPIPSIFLRNPIITEGCPSNLKIPYNIGHVHVGKAFIDLNTPINVMNRMLYNWIMRRKLDPMDDPNRGVSNFTGRIKGMYAFV